VSVWRIGHGRTVGKVRSGGPLDEFIDVVVKWIPGEIVAFYAAGITMLSDGSDKVASPNRGLWLGALAATVALALLSSKKAGKSHRQAAILAALAAAAFLIWSAAMPFSGWQSIAWFSTRTRGLAVGAALVGIVFAKVAEWWSDQLKL
jgi:hypothetical protein